MADPGPHLDETTWERLALGELPAAEREAALAHVVRCAACAATWRGLLALGREARTFDRGVPRAAPSWRARVVHPPSWQLLAASLLVAATGAALVYRALSRADDAGGRASSASAITAARDIALPSEAPAWVAALTLAKAEIRVSPADVLVFRGRGEGGEPPIAELATALEPYRRDDFAEAARRLAALSASYPRATRVALYLGVSLLFLDRKDEALGPLGAAVSSQDAAVSNDARWYLAVAHARAGRVDRAEQALAPLCAAGMPRALDACRALGAVPERLR